MISRRMSRPAAGVSAPQGSQRVVERAPGAVCQACQYLTGHADWCPHYRKPGIQYPCPGRCGKLTPGGRCDECKAAGEKARDARRGKTAERGYDARWRKLREWKLRNDPVCQIQTHCIDGLANEVDHCIPIVERPDLRLDWDNLQSSCKSCHSAKTKRENARGSSANPQAKRAESSSLRVV
jgi:5-methylcytosine-specific restriction enzyme A